jgi:hypothetical protein
MRIPVICSLALTAFVAMGRPPDASAQPTIPDQPPAVVPPAAAPTWSMGQPPIYTWQTGLLIDTQRPAALGLFGVQKDLLSPMVGLAALRVEGVLGGSEGHVEGGGRLLFVSPVGRLHAGIDVDARSGDADWLVGLDLNVRRGGVLGRGTRLRIDWMPWRDNTVLAGVHVPLGGRAGTTRPRTDRVRFPSAAAAWPTAARVNLAAPRREFRAAAEALTRLVLPLRSRLGGDARQAVAEDVAAVSALGAPDDLAQRMVRGWTQLFAVALSAGGPPADAVVSRVATRARRIILEDVLLPFDGMFAQRRTPATLTYYGPPAARRFEAELAAMADLAPAQRMAAAAAFAAAIDELDGVRAGIRAVWHSDRRVFVPLQLALPPDESDTQAELDALIERATGNQFIDGNRIYYVLNEAFQFEFMRAVRKAEQYHVLWIHDVRGLGDVPQVDKVSAMHVHEYLQALTTRVRTYDEVGRLPQYFIVLDQFYYQANNGRLWMNLLEDPLGRTITLPDASAAEQRVLRAAQQELRDAVATSRRLQAGRAQHGEAWLRGLVKVHVNITHPSDFSFWAPGLIKIAGVPDNLMRDHRKIVFYDITEDDPYRGEVVFSGMGLGEWYAGPTWEDRALIVEGPAALAVKGALRRVFERQRIPTNALPEVFQARPLAPDYAARVEAERRRAEAGVIPPARAMQAHNDVGYGDKKASVVKALLASLMPRGTVIISPDSLWEDALLGSLLMGSALRGCRVMVIAPDIDNAPGTAWPVLARMHMVFSRLLALSKGLDARITAEGGLFKVGLFSEESEVGDQAGRMHEIRRNLGAASEWFAKLAPFDRAGLDQWSAQAEALSRQRPAQYLARPSKAMRPKLHMKGFYAASASGWDGLFDHPEMMTTVMEYQDQRSRQVSADRNAEVDVRAVPRAVWAARKRLLAAHDATLTPEQRARVVFYMQIGSYNMNDRSMLLDGEVAMTVAGPAATTGMLDFLTIAGLSKWVDHQEQIDAMIPPPSALHRLLARWARSLL